MANICLHHQEEGKRTFEKNIQNKDQGLLSTGDFCDLQLLGNQVFLDREKNSRLFPLRPKFTSNQPGDRH